MKITPISNNYNVNTHSKQQSFNGLWGLTSKNSDIEPTLGVNKINVTYYYYPFADETEEEIKSISAANNKAYLDDKHGPLKYIVKECKICSTLPFKKIHYDKYSEAQENDRYTSNNRRVHLSVRDKYKDNAIEKQQPALNPVFDEKERKKKLDATFFSA